MFKQYDDYPQEGSGTSSSSPTPVPQADGVP